MVPRTQLVNLNSASADDLARLFTAVGVMPTAEAAALAQRVVTWRESRANAAPSRGTGRLQSPEDLFQVEGMTRAVWDVLRDYVDAQGAGGSASAAPGPVLGSTQTSGVGGGLTAVDREAGDVSAFRMDAFVSAGGRTWLRRAWANIGPVHNSAVPWRLSRVEAPRVVEIEQAG
ncbi:MAG: general secretion pathway protein GspK [Halioglobus sp.]|nr:general secretion pathway protein GspK [Halioglobus sp.]